MKGQDLFFNLHKSANIMLDKSNRKHENAYRLNATCVDSSRTNAVDNKGHYLTNYAYNMITEQLSLTKAMCFDKTTYFVCTPEDFNEKKHTFTAKIL